MKKTLKWTSLILVLLLIILSLPEIFHKNKGESRDLGSVRNGKLENGYLLPYSGKNFRYFSPLSYYILNNAYTHSTVYKTILEAYKTCEQTCPGVRFRLMECSNKDGGKMPIHRTHQNGMSADFMVPKKKKGRQSKFFDRVGIFHYLLEFTPSGGLNLNKKVEIDFESMARHLLALDDAARENGLRIRKVIFKINLKDDLFATESGKKLLKRDIYFVRSLSKIVDDVHDDHYHVDFECF